MSQLHKGFQVKQYKPWKLWFGIIAVALLLSVFFWLGQTHQSQELSQFKLERETLVSQIEDLESRNYNLIQKNAQLSRSSKVEHDAYTLANQELIKLQQLLLEQKEELVFYQGIVSPQDAALRIKLQTVQVKQKNTNGEFNYKIVLSKRGQGSKKMVGKINVFIHGEYQGSQKKIPLHQMSATQKEKDIKFSFRYFQSFEGELSLMDGFTPVELEVNIISNTRKVKSFTENILWTKALSEDN